MADGSSIEVTFQEGQLMVGNLYEVEGLGALMALLPPPAPPEPD
jgi:hypothetical protein